MIALLKWGDTWMADEQGPPLTLMHRTCGHATTPSLVCWHCGAAIEPRAMQADSAPHAGKMTKPKPRARRHHETYCFGVRSWREVHSSSGSSRTTRNDGAIAESLLARDTAGGALRSAPCEDALCRTEIAVY